MILLFTLGAALFGYHAAQLRMTAGFDTMLPFEHPMVRRFQKYRAESQPTPEALGQVRVARVVY